ncbi:MAG: LysE family transporter [Gammaproteobacteria bacterium]|jgi:RhtB (resistance to homoserine/threonine) family protein|nr:LysE family transporter [Gammaproteobacteria bacterium]
MGYLNDFIALGVIGLLGAISPGPDFVVVTQSSLSHGKKAGMATSLGISLGCLVHITYCVLGIGVIVAESIVLFNIIKYLGAAYLVYLGIKALRSSNTLPKIEKTFHAMSTHHSLFSAFKKGLLVNLLNPKVTLFILSIFTQVISPETPLLIQASFGIEFAVIAFCWFSLLSFILDNPVFKKRLQSVQGYVEKILGGFLILLGIKVATITQ